MKKILLTAMSLAAFGFAHAQTALTQDFNGTTGTALPAGWSQKNLDGATPSANMGAFATSMGTNAWISRGTTDRILSSTSYYNPVDTAIDWIVTPQINIPANNYWCVFQAQTQDAQYPDGFVVKISTTDTAVASFTTTLLTVPAATTSWEYYAINLAAYSGQNVYIAIINNSVDKFILNIDNFSVKVLPAKEVGVTSFTPGSETRPSFTTVGGAGINLAGTIFNYGATPITSLDLKWSDGGAPNTQTLTGLNILPYKSYSFTHSTPATFSSVTSKAIKFWTALPGDANPLNDSAKTDLGSYQDKPTYHITFEEGTGTWCGWCPRGAVYMDSMENVNGDKTTLIAVHNADPMVVTAYDAGIGGLIGGYPSCVANREAELDPSDMFVYFAAHKDDYGYGNVELTGTLSGTSLNCTGKFTPSGNLKGNYRMAFVITEDFVTGTAAGYNQTNYYSSTSQNLDLIGNGVNWKTLANPVPAASMSYSHVAKYIADGFTGTPLSLPTPMTAGTAYSKAFTYTLPVANRAWLTKAHLLIVNQDYGFIANSATMQLALNTSSLIKEVDGMAFYPNPASSIVNFNITALANSDAQIMITNNSGQVVRTVAIGLVAGANTQQVDVANLADGIYSVTLMTKSGKISAPLTITR
jgi:hypothetical protein